MEILFRSCKARARTIEGMENNYTKQQRTQYTECMRTDSSTGQDNFPSSDTAVKVGPASSRTFLFQYGVCPSFFLSLLCFAFSLVFQTHISTVHQGKERKHQRFQKPPLKMGTGQVVSNESCLYKWSLSPDSRSILPIVWVELCRCALSMVSFVVRDINIDDICWTEILFDILVVAVLTQLADLDVQDALNLHSHIATLF